MILRLSWCLQATMTESRVYKPGGRRAIIPRLVQFYSFRGGEIHSAIKNQIKRNVARVSPPGYSFGRRRECKWSKTGCVEAAWCVWVQEAGSGVAWKLPYTGVCECAMLFWRVFDHVTGMCVCACVWDSHCTWFFRICLFDFDKPFGYFGMYSRVSLSMTYRALTYFIFLWTWMRACCSMR